MVLGMSNKVSGYSIWVDPPKWQHGGIEDCAISEMQTKDVGEKAET